MENYIELLEAIGITLDPESIPFEVEDHEIHLDLQPYYDSKNKMYYTTRQMEEYGEQEGDYYVVESRELVIGTDYEDEIIPGQKKKPHLYNRTTRFRYCLTQLLTQSGEVPAHVMVKVCDSFGVDYELEEWVSRYHCCLKQKITITSKLDYDPDTIWGLMRKFLKGMKLGLYYNRIPTILCTVGVPGTKCTVDQYNGIMEDFKLLNDGFDSAKKYLKITYFPDLRYVALRLMNKHGVVPKYHIPWLNTKRKIKTVGDTIDYIFESSSTDGSVQG